MKELKVGQIQKDVLKSIFLQEKPTTTIKKPFARWVSSERSEHSASLHTLWTVNALTGKDPEGSF